MGWDFWYLGISSMERRKSISFDGGSFLVRWVFFILGRGTIGGGLGGIFKVRG